MELKRKGNRTPCKCAMVYCDRREHKHLNNCFTTLPPLGKKNMNPKGFDPEAPLMTEVARRSLLSRTLRDERWVESRVASITNVRMCIGHIDPEAKTFEILPPERDPIFLEWLFSSLNPDYVQGAPTKDEERARLLIRERVMRSNLVPLARIPPSLVERYEAACTLLTALPEDMPCGVTSISVSLSLPIVHGREPRKGRRKRKADDEKNQTNAGNERPDVSILAPHHEYVKDEHGIQFNIVSSK